MIDLIRERLSGLSGVKVFDSFVRDDELQQTYVLVIGSASSRSGDEAMSGGPSGGHITVRAVGVTPGQVRSLLESTRDRLRNLHAVSNGRRYAFYWEGSPRPIQSDQQAKNDLGTFPVWLDDEYSVYVEKV